MSTEDLSQRYDNAENAFTDLNERVQQTAASAHRDVTSKLEHALTSLLQVVAKVHASYKEDGEPDEERKKLLQEMKNSFGDAEGIAATRTKDFGTLYEQVTTLENQIIVPLLQEVKALGDQSETAISEAEAKQRILQSEIDSVNQELRDGEGEVNSISTIIIDNPIADFAITIASPFAWLADQAQGNTERDIGALRRDLKYHQERLQGIRDAKYGLERRIEEANTERSRVMWQLETASSLLRKLEPLKPRAQNLAVKTNKFKEALIHIKAKATSLNAEASDVEASASVTSTKSYSKADFAAGIINICKESVFDFAMKDEAESILAELSRVWTVDGNNTMSSRLKKQFDDVQTLVNSLKEGNARDEWNKAVADADQNHENTGHNSDDDEDDKDSSDEESVVTGDEGNENKTERDDDDDDDDDNEASENDSKEKEDSD